MMNIKKNRVLRNLLIDAVCLGVALVVFALFHHVLPRQQQSVGIVIPNPYKTETNTGTDSSLALPEDTVYLAAGGMSDGGLNLSAARNSRGTQKNNSKNTMNSKGGMTVKNVNEIVREVFDVTGFSDILTVE